MKIDVRELVFQRGGRFRLQVPDLQVPHGSVTAILGPNGSGKTTLMRLLAGLELPDCGTVHLNGAPAAAVASREVSYAFQEAVFFSGTVRRNLELALDLRGVSQQDARQRIDEVTAATGTGDLLSADAQLLSGGEAQRLNLARALSLRAPLTLLDEPLAQLDGAIRLKILDELPDLFERFAETVILVTHANEEALRLADRLIVLVDGEIRASAEKSALLESPPDALVAELLGFAVLPSLGGLLAIRPGGLSVGPGAVVFPLVVRRVVSLAHGREILGTIGEARVAVALPSGVAAPRPGESIEVSAAEAIPIPG